MPFEVILGAQGI